MAKLSKADMESWLVADGRGIKIIGDYLGVNTKTTFECSDRHQWNVRPSNIKSGRGCPVCSGGIKLTKSDMESWLVTDGRGIKLIGEYTNIRTHTKFKCTHGHQWDAAPHSIKSGTGCPHCSVKGRTLTKSDIESWLVTDGRGIKLIGDYINSVTKTSFECAHGHIWSTKPDNMKRYGCFECAVKRRTLTESDMKSWLITDGRGIKMISDYINSATKTTFECAHGHQWETQPGHIKSGRGCPFCSVKGRTLTKSDMESWLITDGRGIKLIGEYSNISTKTTFECTHGHQWDAMPSNIKRGIGCPHCAKHGFNPGLPAWSYILTRGTYLKYGISNNLNRRLSEHKRHGDIEVVHLKYHENGQDALEWENLIKETFGGKYATAANCPDGWTETLPISHLQLLLEEKFIDKIPST